MTPDDYAYRICALLIRRGFLVEDNPAHHAVLAVVREVLADLKPVPGKQSWRMTPPTLPGWFWWRVDGNTPAIAARVLYGGQCERVGFEAMPAVDAGGEWWGPVDVPR